MNPLVQAFGMAKSTKIRITKQRKRQTQQQTLKDIGGWSEKETERKRVNANERARAIEK